MHGERLVSKANPTAMRALSHTGFNVVRAAAAVKRMASRLGVSCLTSIVVLCG